MANQFRPLEEIQEDDSVNFGDLIMLKLTGDTGVGFELNVKVVYRGEIDTYVSDGSSGLKRGEEFRGLRIFDHLRGDGSLGICSDSVFLDYEKGLLLPFEDRTYHYALIMSQDELPR